MDLADLEAKNSNCPLQGMNLRMPLWEAYCGKSIYNFIMYCKYRICVSFQNLHLIISVVV